MSELEQDVSKLRPLCLGVVSAIAASSASMSGAKLAAISITYCFAKVA